MRANLSSIRRILGCSIFLPLCLCAAAQELPHLDRTHGTPQLIVAGRPFIAFGGELGNSSAGTAAQADTIVPRAARAHINTLLIPVAWEQFEPAPGKFEFAILDHWIEQARLHNIRLVLLWFGSWKNAFSNYAPEWVKRDPGRFPRALSPEGRPLGILSTLSTENMDADARAFRALLRHVREFDAAQQTVIMVQVQNEVGILGSARDHSPQADRLFNGPVPDALMQHLRAHRNTFPPEWSRLFNDAGRTWREVFKDAAPEAFMAWNYALYIGRVASAGKAEYPLPMFANAQLPAPLERAGDYPSGAPHPAWLEVYRAAAPALDFYSPDIYWSNFEYWVDRYNDRGNAIFIPEARLDAGPYNAFYAYGEARAIGFSPFATDSLPDVKAGEETSNPLARSYAVLRQLEDILPQAQREGRTRGLVLHASSPRPTQTVALGGYLFTATLARSWPARTLLQDDGAMIVLQTAPGEFLLAGSALSITAATDVDSRAGITGIASVEEGSRSGGTWTTARVLNGDQTNQGRTITLPGHQFKLLRVKLYTTPLP